MRHPTCIASTPSPVSSPPQSPSNIGAKIRGHPWIRAPDCSRISRAAALMDRLHVQVTRWASTSSREKSARPVGVTLGGYVAPRQDSGEARGSVCEPSFLAPHAIVGLGSSHAALCASAHVGQGIQSPSRRSTEHPGNRLRASAMPMSRLAPALKPATVLADTAPGRSSPETTIIPSRDAHATRMRGRLATCSAPWTMTTATRT